MTALLWFLAGGFVLGSPIGLALHLLLSRGVRRRAIAEGRGQVLQRDSYPSVAAPKRRRRSPDQQLVTTHFERLPARPGLTDHHN